jgi:hypothetical protein
MDARSGLAPATFLEREVIRRPGAERPLRRADGLVALRPVGRAARRHLAPAHARSRAPGD